MQVFSSTDLNFSDSAIDHFLSSLKNRGKGVGIKIGVKKAGCSGYEYFFDYVDSFDDDGVVFEKNGCKIKSTSNIIILIKINTKTAKKRYRAYLLLK